MPKGSIEEIRASILSPNPEPGLGHIIRLEPQDYVVDYVADYVEALVSFATRVEAELSETAI